jgi:hypothetical protein
MRVEAMKKSFQGRKYLDNALETICRTAESGILPVLYLIMTDPTTTLAQLASELRTTVQLVDAVYSRTGVVPRLSYSLMMLPVASTAVVTKHAHRVTEVEVGEGTMRLPSEFLFEPRVTRFLAHVAAETQSLPQRRENLAALPVYLDCVARAVEHEPREDGESIAMVLEATRTLWLDLSRRLDEDARRTALAMLGAAPPQHGTRLYYDYRRLGCYVPGIELMLGLLQGESRHAATA